MRFYNYFVILITVFLILFAGSASAELKLWYQMDSADDFNVGTGGSHYPDGFYNRNYIANNISGNKYAVILGSSHYDPAEGALYMDGVHQCKNDGVENGNDIFTSSTQYTFSLWAKSDPGITQGGGYSFFVKFSSGQAFKCDLPFRPTTDPGDPQGARFSSPGDSWENNAYGIWNPENSSIYVDPATWNMYTFTWDADNNMIATYVNGILRASYDGGANGVPAITPGATVTEYGLGDAWGWSGPGGWFKDFRVYDRALDADDVWKLANPPSPSDLDEDGFVNMDDLQILVNDWLDDSLVKSDINKDGIVNFKDYAILLDSWYEGGKYYFDSVGGSDDNSGNSPEQAWQSLGKFNNKIFFPGDRVYFKAGSQWDGSLEPKGSGTAEAVIIIDAYGDISDENSKPRIDGNGVVNPTLGIYNVEYWEINNLQITNLGTTRAAHRRAVDVRASDFGTMKHIHLKNLYVHSVNGLISKQDGGGCGISWANVGDVVLTKIDGLLIEGCHIKTTDRDGIVGGNTKIGMQTNAWPRDYGNDWYPSVNVIIRGNLLEDIGGDGIVPVGTDGCLVEYNVIKSAACRTYNYSPKQTSAGIWPWSADNTVIQYNEVSGMKGTADGQGFDSDYNTANSLFQYNYSHDNEGGFLLVCDNLNDGIGNIGTVVRYNISQNDQERTFYIGAGIQAYNNIIYNGPGSDLYLMYTVSGNRGQSVFKNNIFMSLGTYRFTYAAMQSSNNAFSNNCWIANSWQKKSWLGAWSSGKPGDPYAITSNPQFINPGSGGNGFDTLDGYKLQSISPCIGAGTTITDNGGYDFWGNVLYNGNPDIGAQEY